MGDYDVIVVGGGSAGTAAAAAANRAGARTAMINDGELGGLCILRGCMPTKAMLASAHAAHEPTVSERFGVHLDGRMVPDFERIMDRKDELVARFKRAKIDSIERHGYDVIDSRARFAAGGGIEIDGRILTARAYVIATGSRPAILPMPGLENTTVLTSDDVMRLRTRPNALVVQGAGPIGLEMAQFFSHLGTHVTLVNRSPILARFDPEAGEELRATLEEDDHMELAVPGRIEHIRRDGSGATFRIRIGDTVIERRADALLMAAGRDANVEDLGLDHLGIMPDDGRLCVDEHMRSLHPDVFVAGDATGEFQVLHIANLEGAVAGRNAAGADPPQTIDYRLKMTMVFTDPPFARVGIGEHEARTTGRRIVTGRARFAETGRAITMGVGHGIWKLHADPETGEVVGTSIVGPRADDLAHIVSTLMSYRGTIHDIADMPWYHPTLSEVMLDLYRDVQPQLTGPRR